MSDLIDRQAAIDAVINADYKDCGVLVERRCRKFEEALRSLPTAEERETALDWRDIYSDLPDEPGEYLLTVESRQSGRRWVDQVYFNGTSFDHNYLAKPVAWAEKPVPYQR